MHVASVNWSWYQFLSYGAKDPPCSSSSFATRSTRVTLLKPPGSLPDRLHHRAESGRSPRSGTQGDRDSDVQRDEAGRFIEAEDGDRLPDVHDARFPLLPAARLLRNASMISMTLLGAVAPSSLALPFFDGRSAFFFLAMMSSSAS